MKTRSQSSKTESKEESSWTTAHPIARLRQELNRVLETSLHDLSTGLEMIKGWGPSLDILESKDAILVKAEVPGLKKEDINITVQGNQLTISGERERDSDEQKVDLIRSERFFGRFKRQIHLPQPIDSENIKASYKEGVLILSLPKTEDARRKEITIDWEK